MDLVFKRYSSPFLFLDILIESGSFCSGIDELFNLKNEDRLWELYLATIPLNDKSYEDWKKENVKNNKTSVEKEITTEYVETAIKKSQNILSNFNPLK